MKILCKSLIVLFSLSTYAQDNSNSIELTIKRPPIGYQTKWHFYRQKKYLEIEGQGIHIFGSASTSDWMMKNSHHLILNMVAALKDPLDQKKFSGHEAYIVTDNDPPINARQQRNTGGKGYSLFNEVLVCASAFDTLYPENDRVINAWDTPVHEFGHAIEITLGLQNRSDEIFSKNSLNYNPKQAREYFPWAVQQWFDSSNPSQRRATMQKWKFDYLSTIFDADNHWKPDCTTRNPDISNIENAELASLEIEKLELIYNKSIQKISTNIKLEDLVGAYQVKSPTNDWQMGEISIIERHENGHPKILKWRNRSGQSWRLYPDLEFGGLKVESEKSNAMPKDIENKKFLFLFDKGKINDLNSRVVGFSFNKSNFLKISR